MPYDDALLLFQRVSETTEAALSNFGWEFEWAVEDFDRLLSGTRTVKGVQQIVEIELFRYESLLVGWPRKRPSADVTFTLSSEKLTLAASL